MQFLRVSKARKNTQRDNKKNVEQKANICRKQKKNEAGYFLSKISNSIFRVPIHDPKRIL